MKPAAFSYHRPRDLPEVFALLATHGEAAKLIAGGQSLAPMMNMRLAQPAHLIDLNDLHDLAYVRDHGDTIAVGALVRQHELERSELLASACPLLHAAAGTIGHYAIRQRGTIGGSMAHADPAAQLPLVAITLDAEIDVASARGRRTIATAEFFVSVMSTALEMDEVVVEIRFPKRRPREGWAFELFSRRHGDFALVALAATVTLDAAGRIAQLRIGIGGVDAVPLALRDLAARSIGRVADASWCADAAATVQAQITPEDDPRVPAVFRKELAATLTRRALLKAIARATAK